MIIKFCIIVNNYSFRGCPNYYCNNIILITKVITDVLITIVIMIFLITLVIMVYLFALITIVITPVVLTTIVIMIAEF